MQKEREATAVVLRHFLLVEKRRLYALKHPSLFAWATEELGYSEGAAQRRIDAARLLGEIPSLSLAEKIESGALSLTNLSQAKSFFRQEKKAGKHLPPAVKAAVLSSLECKSSREGLKALVSISSNPHLLAAKGTLRSLGNGKCEMRLIVTEELVEDLKRIKGLFAHALPDADWQEIIARMAKITLDKIDPLKKAERAKLAKEKKALAKASGADGGTLVAGGKVLAAGSGVYADCGCSIVETPSGVSTDTSNGAREKRIHGAAPSGDGGLTAGGEEWSNQREHLREDIDANTGEVQICLPLIQAQVQLVSKSQEQQPARPPTHPQLLPQAQAQAQLPSKPQSKSQQRPLPVSESRAPRSKLPQPHALPPAVATKRSRSISVATSHEVWLRDQGQCSYVDADGNRCSSCYALERDHKLAFAAGGGNEAGNIRLYCRVHNVLHADETFGCKKMDRMREDRLS